MLIIGLFALTGLGLGLSESTKEEFGSDRGIFSLFLMIFMGLVGLGASLIIGGIVEQSTEDTYESSYDFSIEATADGSLTQGSFHIFGGSINETPMYFFYRQWNNGSITQGNIPVSEAVIYEDVGEGEQAYITVVLKDRVDAHPWFVIDPSYQRTYEIHVPEGSVLRQHVFDLN